MDCIKCDGHGVICPTCSASLDFCECIHPPHPTIPRSELRTTTCPACGGDGKEIDESALHSARW